MKKLISLLLAVIMVLAFAGCGDKSNNVIENESENETEEKETMDNNDAPLVNETSASVIEERVFNIGDTVTTDSAELVLSSVKIDDTYGEVTVYTNQYSKPGYSFIVLSFSVKNIGKKALSGISTYGGGWSIVQRDMVYIDYNNGYTFFCEDVNGLSTREAYNVSKTNINADSSVFYSPTSIYLSDLKPLSEAQDFLVCICVPNKVVENPADPLNAVFLLPNSLGKTESFIFDIRDAVSALESNESAKNNSSDDTSGIDPKIIDLLENGGDDSEEFVSYFSDNLASYRRLSGKEIQNMIVGKWYGLHTGREWTFFVDGSIDDGFNYQRYGYGDYHRTWIIDGDYLVYTGLLRNGKEQSNQYEVWEVTEGAYLLTKNGTPYAGMTKSS